MAGVVPKRSLFLYYRPQGYILMVLNRVQTPRRFYTLIWNVSFFHALLLSTLIKKSLYSVLRASPRLIIPTTRLSRLQQEFF